MGDEARGIIIDSTFEVGRRFPDPVFDAVEIRPARLPVIRVAGELDVLVRLVVDEFEWASADRMLAHVAWRDMARIVPV